MFEGATAFNQCLSTLADEFPPNVSANGIFEGSGYQSKDTVATVSPWCQCQDEQCLASPRPIDCTSLHNATFWCPAVLA